MEWGEHHQCLFHGTERFFRASYSAHLLTSWLPALDGAVDKLKKSGHVADVGCGPNTPPRCSRRTGMSWSSNRSRTIDWKTI